MKKRRFYFCIAVGIGLSGCGSADQMSGEIVQTNDSLKICVLDYDKRAYLDLPLAKFQEKYPDVDVELEILSAENLSESQEIAATEIMAGDGADIYIRPSALFEDTYKIQEAGMFEDLMPWLEQMEGFDPDHYLSGTFDLYENTEACYIFPIGLVPGVLAIDRSMADMLNLDVEAWNTSADLYDAMEKYYERYPEGSPFMRSEPYSLWLSGRGFRIYEGKKNLEILDSQLLKRDMALCKKQAYPEGKFISREAEEYYETELEQMYRGEGDYLGRAFAGYNVEEYLRMGGGEEYILLPEYDDMGNVRMTTTWNVAVLADSSNKENALHLIETILEEDNKPGWGHGVADREKNKDYLQQLHDQWVKDEVVVDGKVRAGLTEEDYQVIEEVYQKGVIVNESPVYPKFQEIMEPFFTNESSYEACMEEFRNYLELYYSE